MSAQRDAYSKHGAGSYSLVRVLPDISQRIWRKEEREDSKMGNKSRTDIQKPNKNVRHHHGHVGGNVVYDSVM